MTPAAIGSHHRQRRRVRDRKFVRFPRIASYVAAKSPGMDPLSVRMPPALVHALNAAAYARGATRSALIRAVLEDALDVDRLPEVPETAAEMLARLQIEQMERLRELTRG
jgi:hypothetical protein